MAARLPVPGGDDGTWGQILNDFLSQSHNADGSLKQLSQLQIQNLTSDLGAKADVSALAGKLDLADLDSQTARLVTDGSSAVTSSLKASFIGGNGFFFDPLHPAFGAVGDGATDDTTAVSQAFAAARAVHGFVVFRRMFLVNATMVQDDDFGLIGYGRNVGLKAGPSMPANAPLLWTTKTNNSTAVIEGHMYGAKIDGIRLDGSARTVNCKGWQIDVVTNCDFRNIDIRHFAQEGILLSDSVRESEWFHVHVRGCGDISSGFAAAAINHSSTKDGHNNLHFYGFYSVYPYGIALQIKPSNDTSPTRGIIFHSPMLHGMTSSALTNDDLTITPDWRHVSTPIVEIADARTVIMHSPRFHRSGYGQPLVLIRNNEGTAATQNSVTLLSPSLGTAQDASGLVTIDPATDTFTSSGIKLGTGAMIQFTTSGTLPGGMTAATDYYAIRVTDDTFKIATSRALAESGTALDVTDAGSGQHTVTAQSMSVLIEPAAVTTLRVVAPYITDTIPIRPMIVNKAGNNKVTLEAVTPATGVTFYEPYSPSDYPVIIPGALSAQGASITGNISVSSGDIVLDNSHSIVGKKTDGTQVQIAKVTPSDTISLGNPGNNAAIATTEVKAATTLNLTANGITHRATSAGFAVASSAWNGAHWIIGNYHVWVDVTGRVRVKNSAPASDLDGQLLADQTTLSALLSADAAAINNSNILVTSPNLTVTLDAGATYKWEAVIYYDCSTTADLKLSWAVPTNATGYWTPDGLHTSVTSNSGTIQRLRSDLATAQAVGGAGVGVTVAAKPSGVITTDPANGGQFALKYAQNTADVTDLVLRSGSGLFVRKVA